ncbi:immunoglobulin-like domain-containing protein [Siminovitchia acidinfaciens]|nr:immunoglobulin-like domain-containing protein [Siminovitchia acidinfaciens]
MVMYSDRVFYDFPTFKDIGLILKEGSTEQILPIEKLGITLGPGTYRIVKSFANDENKEILTAVPFKVKKNAS